VPVRVLGPHPKDKQPVELHAGRYGPYVKHRDVNATLPDKDKMDSLTLEEAVALVDAKAGRTTTTKTAKAPARPRAPRVAPSGRTKPAAVRTPRAKPAATRKPAAPKPAATTKRKTVKRAAKKLR
jgi:topoisomerase IA-like protein